MWGHLFDTLCLILVLAVLAGYGYRCYAGSDDRRVLLFKWVASIGLVLIMLLLWSLGRHNPKWLFLFIIPFGIFSFIWLPNVVGIVLKPLTSAFDGGGDEVEAKPFYFIAAAKRIKGLHQEAIAEVRKQLGKFPGDVAGAMLLAAIQAEDLHDVRAAQATINGLLEKSDLTPQEVATALHTLADWQLQQGRDAAAARVSRPVMATRSRSARS